jgi:hypothetical protein
MVANSKDHKATMILTKFASWSGEINDALIKSNHPSMPEDPMVFRRRAFWVARSRNRAPSNESGVLE